jgi:hypothetical protein
MRAIAVVTGVVLLIWLGGGCQNSRSAVQTDGHRLRHRRVIRVTGPITGDRFHLPEVQEAVDLQAVTGQAVPVDLEVTIYEETPDDATVELTRTGLAVRTRSGKPAVIYAVRGTVPNLPLQVRSVSGDVTVRGSRGIEAVEVASTSGDLHVRDVEGVGELTATSVSGDIRVASSRCPGQVRARTVSGEITIDALSEVEELDIETVSGDVDLLASHARTVRINTTSGDLHLGRGSVENLSLRSVSGDARLERTQCGEVDFHSVSGRLTRR